MSFRFTIKQGATGPALQVVLYDGRRPSQPVDLTLATAIRFRMRKSAGTAYIVDAPAEFISPRSSGGARYSWVSGDTDEAGDFQGDFLVTFPDRVEVHPGGTYVPIDIYPALVGGGP